MGRLTLPVTDQRVRTLGEQVGWSLGSRIVASILQILVVGLLARALPPAGFAIVATANVILLAIPAVNGFGLLRQIQYRRSRRVDDPQLPSLFARRLRYSYGSAIAWLMGCLVLSAYSHQNMYLAFIPCAIWLLTEQTTQVWNGISIVDKRAELLMFSFLWRRTPVVLALLLASRLQADAVWAWSTGLAIGASLAWVDGRRHQESWARIVWPGRATVTEPTELDFGYWWSQIGDVIRDLDVPALACVSPLVAGLYALPARLVRPMNMITQATGAVAFPILSRRARISVRDLTLGVAIASIPTLFICTFTAIIAPVLPRLVGSDYSGSVVPLQLMCVTAVLWAPNILLTVYMQSRGDHATRIAGAAGIVSNAAQVGAAVAGGVAAGAIGAATFTMMTQLVALAVMAVIAGWWAHSAEPAMVASA